MPDAVTDRGFIPLLQNVSQGDDSLDFVVYLICEPASVEQYVKVGCSISYPVDAVVW